MGLTVLLLWCSGHLMAMSPVRPCGRLMLAFPSIVMRQVSSRSGIARMTGVIRLLAVGSLIRALLVCVMRSLMVVLVKMTTRLLCVCILLRPDPSPLSRWLPGVIVTIGTLWLIRVSGLRPSLFVGQVLVRTQSTLPSPSVFLTVIGNRAL